MAAANRGQISAITGLRALSVIAVVLFHVDRNILPGGFSGVDFFFVISGFVVSLSVASHGGEGLREFLAGFYRRRIIRIVPASYVFILIGLLGAVLFVPNSFLFDRSKTTALASLFGAANIVLYKGVGDYFSPTPEFNFFTHMWSLAVEEQYYLVFPIFGYFVASSRSSKASRRTWIGIFVALCLVSLIGAALMSARDKVFAFYMMPTRFWELAAGAILYWVLERRIEGGIGLSRVAGVLCSVAVAVLIVLSFVLSNSNAFPFPGAILAVVAALSALALSVLSPGSLLARGLSLSPLVYIGNISYSLYLWHWWWVVAARWSFGLDTLAEKAVVIALSVISAAISYQIIEQPVRLSRTVKQASLFKFACAFSVFAAVFLSGAVFLKMKSSHMTTSVTRNEATWYPYIKARTITWGRCAVEKEDGELGGALMVHLKPSACAEASAQGGSRIVALGDSHASAYERMLSRVAAEEGRPVDIYEIKGCPLFRFQAPDRPLSKGCEVFRDKYLGVVLKTMKAGDVLFLPGLRMPRYRDQGETLIRTTQALPSAASFQVQDDKEIAARLTDLTPFIDKGVVVVVEGVKPVMKSAAFMCADWYSRGKSYCRDLTSIPRSEVDLRASRARYSLNYLVSSEPRISVWEPMGALCPGTQCEPYRDGKPIYFDGDHLTGFANDLLYADFKSKLSEIERRAIPQKVASVR